MRDEAAALYARAREALEESVDLRCAEGGSATTGYRSPNKATKLRLEEVTVM